MGRRGYKEILQVWLYLLKGRNGLFTIHLTIFCIFSLEINVTKEGKHRLDFFFFAPLIMNLCYAFDS